MKSGVTSSLSPNQNASTSLRPMPAFATSRILDSSRSRTVCRMGEIVGEDGFRLPKADFRTQKSQRFRKGRKRDQEIFEIFLGCGFATFAKPLRPLRPE